MFESFADFLALGQNALELGLIYGLTALALFLSYSMLNVCDLSTDGCFTLGSVVGAMFIVYGPAWFPDSGLPLWFWSVMSIVAAMLAGSLSGLVTAVLQTRMGVQSLLAGIVVNTALYSVNLAISGNQVRVNMNSTFKKTYETVFTESKALLQDTPFAQQSSLFVALAAVALVILFLSLFLRTRIGLSIRATGSNPDMVRSSSINPAFTTTVGLCISNSITALSGCLLAQHQKVHDINIGIGVVTVALASLLIGGVFMRRGPIAVRALLVVVGAFIFRMVYAVALRLNMPTNMLRAVSAVIVVLTISVPHFINAGKRLHRRRQANRERGQAVRADH